MLSLRYYVGRDIGCTMVKYNESLFGTSGEHVPGVTCHEMPQETHGWKAPWQFKVGVVYRMCSPTVHPLGKVLWLSQQVSPVVHVTRTGKGSLWYGHGATHETHPMGHIP